MPGKGLEILEMVMEGLQATEGLTRSLLGRFGKLDAAEPYLSLGYVGLAYCRDLLGAGGDTSAIKRVLTQSPSDLWRAAGNHEAEIELIKRVQLDRIGEP